MAKKRRIVKQEPEEDYEFVPPEFDEEEFIRKDFYVTKILLVVVIFSAIMGVVCSFIHKAALGGSFGDLAGDICFWIGFIPMLLGLVLMKPLLKLIRFDADLIEMKSMIGNYILYMLLGMGIWIILVNPPFY